MRPLQLRAAAAAGCHHAALAHGLERLSDLRGQARAMAHSAEEKKAAAEKVPQTLWSFGNKNRVFSNVRVRRCRTRRPVLRHTKHIESLVSCDSRHGQ